MLVSIRGSLTDTIACSQNGRHDGWLYVSYSYFPRLLISLTAIPSAVGLIIGFIFGTIQSRILHHLTLLTMPGATNIIRFGPGPNGMMRTLGQYMLGSAATFG